MRSLKLKIPPLLVVAIFAVLMWALSLLLPAVSIPLHFTFPAMALFLLAGLIFSLAGVVSFRNAGTTVNPMAPQETVALVTSGIYTITRNPMYVGFLCFLIAWAVYLSNVYCLAMTGLFVLYMNRYQIGPEENILAEMFKGNFAVYRKRVRRWL